MPMRYFAARRRADRRRDHAARGDRAVPPGSADVVHPSVQGSQRRRLPRGREHLRARLRRAVGRRPRRGDVEVLGAQRQHRLRVLDHRRGTRPARRGGRPRAVRAARLHRHPGRASQRRPVRPARRRRGDGLAVRPGRDQHRLRDGAACRSPASRCRSSRPAARRCSPRSSCSACWCRSRGTRRRPSRWRAATSGADGGRDCSAGCASPSRSRTSRPSGARDPPGSDPTGSAAHAGQQPRTAPQRSTRARAAAPGTASSDRHGRAAESAMTLSPPARVVVAGGHSAGHIEPTMNFADALRRLAPDTRDHRPRHRARPGHPAHPGARATRSNSSRRCRCRAG